MTDPRLWFWDTMSWGLKKNTDAPPKVKAFALLMTFPVLVYGEAHRKYARWRVRRWKK